MASGRPGAGAPQQPSFKTNVNRMKTKRWVDAKTYSYDGDDWGEADEYDEYDGYDDPPQASLPGPATAVRPPQAPYAQQPPRSGSPGRSQPGQDHRQRSDSFDRGDEKRAFSGPPGSGSPRINPIHTAYGSPGAPASPRVPQPPGGSPLIAATSSPGFPPARPSFEGQHRPGVATGPAPAGAPRPPFASPDASGRTWSMGSQGRQGSPVATGPPNPSFAQRRDYSPSGAARVPQQTQASRPPRKSSLSQDTPPYVPIPVAQPHVSESHENAGAAPPPAPHFVRPADIYKRLAQQQEKERASQESSRPSLSEIEASWASTTAAAEEEKEDNSLPLRARQPPLNTVAERKSEYDPSHLSSQVVDAPKAPQKWSTSPQLPDFASEDGFGSDFASGFSELPESTANARRASIKAAQEATKVDAAAREADVAKQAAELYQHPAQVSKSNTDQIFDEPALSSKASDSDIGRSDTTSTNAISPIMSRGSAKGQDHDSKVAASNMGSIAEEIGPAKKSFELDSAEIQQVHRQGLDRPVSGEAVARKAKLEVINAPASLSASPIDDTPQQQEAAARRMRADSAAKATVIQNVVENLSAKAQESPIDPPVASRAESPTKGRVRDLVGKAESAASSRRGSESSERGVTPAQERAEGIRPHMPGGWSSYVTNSMNTNKSSAQSPQDAESTSPSSLPGAQANPSLMGDGGISFPSTATPEVEKEAIDIEPTTKKHSVSSTNDPSLQVLEAAGAAAAFAAGSTAAVSSADGTHRGGEHAQNAQLTSTGTFYPDSGRPPLQASADSMTSSIMPTPHGYSPVESNENLASEVPAVAPLRQRVGGGPSSANIHSLDGMAAIPHMPSTYVPASLENSPVDHNDELRQQIVRQLSPGLNEADVKSQDTQMRDMTSNAPPNVAASAEAVVQKPRELRHRFSWEEGSEDLGSEDLGSEDLDSGAASATPPAPVPTSVPAAPVQQVPAAISSNTYKAPKSFGSILGASSGTQPGPRSPPLMEPQMRSAGPLQNTIQSPVASVSPQAAQQPGSISPVIKPTETSIQNVESQIVTTVQPELEPTSVPDENIVESVPPTPITKDHRPPSSIEEHRSRPSSPPAEAVSSPQRPTAQQGARQAGQAPAPGQGPVTPFREILSMPRPEDRIRVYQNTQNTFFHMNTGLNDWMQTMSERHPEHTGLLQSRGQFTTPTPGLPTPTRAQQATAGSSSGHTFGGLRKPGAAASPAINEAGAALKSAGRDTKKLAKGLFAKGKSKLAGRDKGSLGLRSFSKASGTRRPPPLQLPPQPSVSSQPPVQSLQNAPAHSTVPVQSSALPQLERAPNAPVHYSPQSEHQEPPRQVHSAPLVAPAATASPSHQVHVPKVNKSVVQSAPVDNQVDETVDHASEPTDSAPDSPSSVIAPLSQRLTVHHKDMTPFEIAFPGELSIPDKYKNTGNGPSEVTEGADESKTIDPTALKQDTPDLTSSAKDARTLDPGKTGHPSWLNYSPPIFTSNSLDFVARLGSGYPSPEVVKSPPAPHTSPPVDNSATPPIGEIKSTDVPQHVEQADDDKSEQVSPSDRPFSFINFGEQAGNDFSLNEITYEPKPTRELSVRTASTAAQPSTLSSEGQEEYGYLDIGIRLEPEQLVQPDQSKPLPSLPKDFESQQEPQPPSVQHAQTMPANPGPQASYSLFPQQRERSNTQGSLIGDYGPPKGQASVTATVPQPLRKHTRSMSGSASSLLHRALTNLPGGSSPKKAKGDAEMAKLDKKKRRFSGFGFGNIVDHAKGTFRPQQQSGLQNYSQTGSRPQTSQSSRGGQFSHSPATGPGMTQETNSKSKPTTQFPPRGSSAQASRPGLSPKQHMPHQGDAQYPKQGSQAPANFQSQPPAASPQQSVNRSAAAFHNVQLHSKYSPYQSSAPNAGSTLGQPSQSTSQSKSLKVTPSMPDSRTVNSGRPANQSLTQSTTSHGLVDESNDHLRPSGVQSSSPVLSATEERRSSEQEDDVSIITISSQKAQPPNLSVNTNVTSQYQTTQKPSQTTAQANSPALKSAEARGIHTVRPTNNASNSVKDSARSDSSVPSSPAAFPGMNDQPRSANAAMPPAQARGILTRDVGRSPPQIPLPPLPQDAGSSPGKVKNRVTLTPAALRIARQREIELGGETRLNSPEVVVTPKGTGKSLDFEAMSSLGLAPENMATAAQPATSTPDLPTHDALTPRNKNFVDADLPKSSEDTSEHQNVVSEPLNSQKPEKSNTGKENDKKEVATPVAAEVTTEFLSSKDDDDYRPVMSATSFPGQEWNPYELY